MTWIDTIFERFWTWFLEAHRTWIHHFHPEGSWLLFHTTVIVVFPTDVTAETDGFFHSENRRLSEKDVFLSNTSMPPGGSDMDTRTEPKDRRKVSLLGQQRTGRIGCFLGLSDWQLWNTYRYRMCWDSVQIPFVRGFIYIILQIMFFFFVTQLYAFTMCKASNFKSTTQLLVPILASPFPV